MENPEDLARCVDAIEDELTVLQSVYDTLVQVQPSEIESAPRDITLEIPITLSENAIAALSNSLAVDEVSPITPLKLSHLPPIRVKILIPSLYPLHQSPFISSITASLGSEGDQWLNKGYLHEIERRLGTMWSEDKELAGEGSGVIWRWWEWIGSGECLSDLGLLKDDVVRLRPVGDTLMSTFYTALKTYNASQMQSDFEKTAFSCGICLEDRKGKSCIQIPGCGCVFCLPCLSACWTLAITEGSLENVFCPSIDCTKERAIKEGKSDGVDKGITPALVESVVGKNLRERWERIKENRIIETDPTYTICPRPACQRPVPPPTAPTSEIKIATTSSKRVIRLSDVTNSAPSTDTESPLPEPITTAESAAHDERWDRYRRCTYCGYSFCLYCSNTWHGPHSPCAFSAGSSLVQEYLSYAEGSFERQKMELRRGKRNLEKMVAQWQEDEDNKKWMEEKTMPCAGCGVRVERSYGCNHMTCGRCGGHFCFRCGKSISPQDPYAHYRTPGRPCYERLFDPEELVRLQREDVWV